jgi:hypothetical protein
MTIKQTRKQTRKIIRSKKVRTYKGGSVFGFSRKKDTTDILKDLHAKAGNIKLKDFESNFLENIDKLKSRKADCKTMCLKQCSDDKMCEQLNNMMKRDPFYNWGNLCGHSLDVKKCREFIHTYTKLDIYNKYVSSLSANIQNRFNILTRELNEEHLGNVASPKSRSRSSSKSLLSPKSRSWSSSKSLLSPKSRSKSRSISSEYSFKSIER